MRRLAASRVSGPLLAYFCAVLLVLGLTPDDGLAALLPPAGLDYARAQDLARVQRVLNLTAVRARLQALGLSAEDIAARLAALDDAELRELARRADELDAGGGIQYSGDVEGFPSFLALLGVMLGVALLVVLVWYIACELAGSKTGLCRVGRAPTPR